MRLGIVFVGHGTKDFFGLQEFHQTVDSIETMLVRQIRMSEHDLKDEIAFYRGFLELATPTVSEVLLQCAIQEPHQILVVPLFLFNAGHLKKDLPQLAIPAKSRFQNGREPVSNFRILSGIGVESAFVEVTVQRICEIAFVDTGIAKWLCAPVSTATCAGDPVFPRKTAVLLVGRGNRDTQAQETFHQLAEQVKRTLNIDAFFTGYLAGNGVNWRKSLTSIVQEGHREILIQPYLWFHGRLTQQLPQWVESWLRERGFSGQIHIEIGEPLGFHPLLVDFMVKRIQAAMSAPW